MTETQVEQREVDESNLVVSVSAAVGTGNQSPHIEMSTYESIKITKMMDPLTTYQVLINEQGSGWDFKCSKVTVAGKLFGEETSFLVDNQIWRVGVYDRTNPEHVRAWMDHQKVQSDARIRHYLGSSFVQ